LHQTRSVLAAASGGGLGRHERVPPSFGPQQKIFEFASKHIKRVKNVAEIGHREQPMLHRANIIVHRNMTTRPGEESRTEQVIHRDLTAADLSLAEIERCPS
jgi:hypothetical protein